MSGIDLSSTKRKPQRDVLGLVLLGVTLVTCGWVLQSYWGAQEELARARRDRAAVETQVTELKKKMRTLDEGQEDPVSVRARLAAAASAPRVLDLVATLLPPDVRLEDMTVTYDRVVGVDMRVVARRSESYDAFLERLQKSARVKAILPGPESHDKEVSASVHLEYQAEHAP